MSHEYNTSDIADVILVAFRITLRDFVSLNNISHYNLIMNRTHKNKAAFNRNQSSSTTYIKTILYFLLSSDLLTVTLLNLKTRQWRIQREGPGMPPPPIFRQKILLEMVKITHFEGGVPLFENQI